MLQSAAHGNGDLSDPLEVAVHAAVAVNISFGHLPIIDAGISRDAGVGKHDTLVEIVEVNGDLNAANACRSQFDRADAAVHGWIIILSSGRNTNDLGLDVLCDLAQLFDRM